MRVLLVSDFYPPYGGGVEHHVHILATGLVRRGHDVAVATLGTDVDTAVDDGVRIHRMQGTVQRLPGLHTSADRPWAPPVPDPGLSAALRRVLEAERPDVVHGHDWLARSVLPVLGPTPLVTTLHYYSQSCAKKNLLRGGEPCPGPSWGRCFRCARDHYGAVKGPVVVAGTALGGRWERRRSARTVAVSTACAAGNGWDPAEVTVVPNPVPTVTPAAVVPGLPDGPFVLYAGDLRAEKGVEVLLEAYRRLVSPPPLVLIGGQGTPEGPLDGVIALGERPHAEVLAAMGRARFVVAPSIWVEPFGLVLLEALSTGRPVIASAVGGMTDVVEHEVNGLLVPPRDPDALAAACARLLDDATLCERLSDAAAGSVTRFAVDDVIAAIELVYAEVGA